MIGYSYLKEEKMIGTKLLDKFLNFIDTIKYTCKMWKHNCKKGYSKYLNPFSIVKAFKEVKAIKKFKKEESLLTKGGIKEEE